MQAQCCNPQRPGPLRVTLCSMLKWESATSSTSVSQFVIWVHSGTLRTVGLIRRIMQTALLFSSLHKAQV